MTRLLLLIFGVLTIAAIASTEDRGVVKDTNISEELTSSRLLRSRDAGARRRKKRKTEKKNKQKRIGRKYRGRLRMRGKKGKRNQKKRRNHSVSRENSRAVSDSCFDQLVSIMRMWKDIISNFDKQTKRMEKQNGTGRSKSGKKGVFKAVYQKLLSVGEGDKSNLVCAGRTDSPGAAQLTNLTSFLFACQTEIHKTCDPSSWPQPNITKMMMCSELATRFRTEAQQCLDLSIGVNKADTDTACDCWTNSSLAETVEAAKVCKFSTEAKGGIQSRE